MGGDPCGVGGHPYEVCGSLLEGVKGSVHPLILSPEGDCPPPVIPAGGVTTGRGRHHGAEVRVRCGAGLQLLGPSQRHCMETGRWSGPEPTCRSEWHCIPISP